MKIFNIKVNYLILIAGFFFMITALSSCAKKVRFENSSIVPAAQGKVKISKTDNGNYQIDISILNLAEPSNLKPSKKTYVVWLLTDDNGLKSLGQLKSSTGFFSSLLKAEMRATTPYKPTKIFITAENSSQVNEPGSVIFTTSSF